MSPKRSRNLLGAAFVLSMFYVALGSLAHASTLSPTDTCAGASNLSECYQLYIADRLYELHDPQVGAASVVANLGPAFFVMLAAVAALVLVRGARLR